jgi:hypothetical protein
LHFCDFAANFGGFPATLPKVVRPIKPRANRSVIVVHDDIESPILTLIGRRADIVRLVVV